MARYGARRSRFAPWIIAGLRLVPAGHLTHLGYRSRYRLRPQTAEPVIGQIKEARGFRHFLLRGLRKVTRKWDLVCTAHNLLKWAKAMG